MILDAFALVALALDEPAAAEVEALLRRGNAKVTPVNLAEVVDVLSRQGHSPDRVATALAPLTTESLEVVELGNSDGWQAGALRARHYDRASRPLSLADCFALAAAVEDGGLATADPALAAAAQAEGVEVIGLPDSRGERP